MKKYTKGFTLIELLVVIAIIGILASVVLVSLNSARKKGNDTRVIADVQQLRTALESYYNGSAYPDLKTDANNTAGTVPANTSCIINGWNNAGPDNANIAVILNDACSQASNGSAIIINTGAAGTPSAYSLKGQLVSNNAAYFCIDSTGKTNALDNNTASATCH